MGAPVASARPVTIAARPRGTGNAEPIAILISSADFSPIATSYARRRWSWIAASRSNPPRRVEPPETTPPIEATAISVVPPPMSTIRFPIGSWIGRRAPTAAASGSSTSTTSRPPANFTASRTARRSTSEDSLATHASTRGLGKRETPTRRSTTSIIRWVMSNSVITP